MAKLNSKVVQNLFSRRQLMNASFDKLRLVSTYGAFGVVAETREELIIESANNVAGPWKEYHFRVKPGDVHRRPRWISPYHHRLDWQMWIASQSGRVERSPWLYSLLLKLLRQEKDVIDLLESDPWALTNQGDGDINTVESRPKYIRIEKYRYKFYNKTQDSHNADRSNENDGNKSQYWVRERVGRYFPQQGIMNEFMLQDLLNKC